MSQNTTAAQPRTVQTADRGKLDVRALVLLAILLTGFSVIGFTVNGLIKSLLGFYPPALLSSIAAFLGALPVVRLTGGAIARVMPADETSARWPGMDAASVQQRWKNKGSIF